MRASRIFKRCEVRMAINYQALELFLLIGKMVMSCHFFACVWALQTGFSDSKLSTWMGEKDCECGFAASLSHRRLLPLLILHRHPCYHRRLLPMRRTRPAALRSIRAGRAVS